ncbi:uroporphyrinogen-III C-methyltransferase [Aliiglaciecola litoralis]|uniref:Uroporphyrinogen-III C-methyltransferase n=1 Tax=Aliiglaciecola litoralis TaxID=582857 RepID=A0ABP3WX65_9ALTE
MTQKDPSNSSDEENKALEIENASYLEVEESATMEEQEPIPEDNVEPNKKAKTGLLWFVTLINFLLVLAVIAAGYWAWMQWQNLDNSEDNALVEQKNLLTQQQSALSQQSREIESVNANVDSLAQQNRALQQELASLNEQIAMARQQSDTNRKNLEDISGRRPADWLLAEADYLVRIAGRKLWLERDVKTAVAMLQAADSRLQDLSDPSLLPIRQFIASDIQTLQQINQVSLTSVALSVSGLVQQVSNLPLSLPEAQSDNAKPEEVEGLARIWAYILSNFKYQVNTTPIKPLLSDQQQWLAREQLRYALLQAQSAVMQEQVTLFKQSIQRAIGLLVEHFDLDADEVVNFAAALKNLEMTSLERNYPEQLDSATPLQDMLERRMNNSFSNGKFEL